MASTNSYRLCRRLGLGKMLTWPAASCRGSCLQPASGLAPTAQNKHEVYYEWTLADISFPHRLPTNSRQQQQRTGLQTALPRAVSAPVLPVPPVLASSSTSFAEPSARNRQARNMRSLESPKLQIDKHCHSSGSNYSRQCEKFSVSATTRNYLEHLWAEHGAGLHHCATTGLSQRYFAV